MLGTLSPSFARILYTRRCGYHEVPPHSMLQLLHLRSRQVGSLPHPPQSSFSCLWESLISSLSWGPSSAEIQVCVWSSGSPASENRKLESAWPKLWSRTVTCAANVTLLSPQYLSLGVFLHTLACRLLLRLWVLPLRHLCSSSGLVRSL